MASLVKTNKIANTGGGATEITIPTDGLWPNTTIAANAIDSDQYVDGSIDNAHLAANSVDSDQYVDGSIDDVHLAIAKLSLSGGTMSGETIFADQLVTRPTIKDYSETKTALSAAATVDIDLEDGNVFTLTADQNTTFTFSNPSPTGKSCSFTLIWTQDSSDRTITWPASVDWAGGSAPDVTSGSGKIDVYTFFTLDAGTIWYGFQAGADMG